MSEPLSWPTITPSSSCSHSILIIDENTFAVNDLGSRLPGSFAALAALKSNILWYDVSHAGRTTFAGGYFYILDDRTQKKLTKAYT